MSLGDLVEHQHCIFNLSQKTAHLRNYKFFIYSIYLLLQISSCYTSKLFTSYVTFVRRYGYNLLQPFLYQNHPQSSKSVLRVWPTYTLSATVFGCGRKRSRFIFYELGRVWGVHVGTLYCQAVHTSVLCSLAVYATVVYFQVVYAGLLYLQVVNTGVLYL